MTKELRLRFGGKLGIVEPFSPLKQIPTELEVEEIVPEDTPMICAISEPTDQFLIPRFAELSSRIGHRTVCCFTP